MVIEAQRRQTQRRPAVNAPAPSKSRRDYSVFKHEDHRLPKAKVNCSECHTIPSPEAPDAVSAATKTSIKGYPYHDSCLGCHRNTAPRFFQGTAPVICVVCHTRSSPRLSARDLFRFPKRTEARARELVSYFSHGNRDHQNATRNCAACHLKDERASVEIRAGHSETAYMPVVGTFRTLPSGHASCFGNCHWDKYDPKKDNGAGCHFTADALAGKKRNLLSSNATEWFKDWPSAWPKRLALKFNHESKSHREEENPELVCTSCHNKIKKSEPLEIPDVPIATCAQSGCHFERASRTSIRKEMFEEDDDIAEGRNNDPRSKTGQHTCTGCHTSGIGSAPPPCSHYLLFGDKYFKIEDYEKSAKQISERCKK